MATGSFSGNNAIIAMQVELENVIHTFHSHFLGVFTPVSWEMVWYVVIGILILETSICLDLFISFDFLTEKHDFKVVFLLQTKAESSQSHAS